MKKHAEAGGFTRLDPKAPLQNRGLEVLAALSAARGEKPDYLDPYSRHDISGDAGAVEARLAAIKNRQEDIANALVSGSLEMLGLTDLKKKHGSAWPRLSAKVHLIVEGILRKYLRAEDHYIKLDDTLVIVVFSDPNAARAHDIVAKAAAEINRQLSGEDSTNLCVALGRDIVLSVLGGFKTIAEASAEERRRLVLGAFEANSAREGAELQSFLVRVREHAVVKYWPTMTLAKRMISAYEAVISAAPNARMAEPKSEELRQLARAAFEAVAIEEAGRHLARTGRGVAGLVVPVAWASLSGAKPARDLVVAACRDALPARAKHRLIVSLRQAPSGLLHNQLLAVLAWPAPFILGYLLPPNVVAENHGRLEGLRVLGVEVDAGAWDKPTDEIAAYLKRLIELLKATGLRCLISGIRSAEIYRVLARAFPTAYLNGGAVTRELSSPGMAMRV